MSLTWRHFWSVYIYKCFLGGGSMSLIIDKKKQVVQEISDQFSLSKSSVLVDYRVVYMTEITALRKELRNNQVDYKVYKYLMTKRAIAGTAFEALSYTLAGPTAIAFGKEDVVPPAKILADFAKDH